MTYFASICLDLLSYTLIVINWYYMDQISNGELLKGIESYFKFLFEPRKQRVDAFIDMFPVETKVRL